MSDEIKLTEDERKLLLEVAACGPGWDHKSVCVTHADRFRVLARRVLAAQEPEPLPFLPRLVQMLRNHGENRLADCEDHRCFEDFKVAGNVLAAVEQFMREMGDESKSQHGSALRLSHALSKLVKP